MSELSQQAADGNVVHRVEKWPVVTRAKDFREITRDVERWLETIRAGDGLVTVFLQHCSASLVLQENKDPSVVADLLTALDKLAPQDANYTHRGSGPDAMPSHIRAMLTQPSLSIPVHDGHMMLGRRQGLFVAEHCERPQPRDLALHFAGTQRALNDGGRPKRAESGFVSAWAT